ncbi:hypothetical protein NEOKW01_0851 [Nematocida sp. AWRm80]|nr:hypothetical protein NEOKW01_0851 [Nematocida sp. AWRm80]
MHLPSTYSPGKVLDEVLVKYIAEKKLNITKEQRELLVDYLLSYTTLSKYIPSEMEINSLASNLSQEKKSRIENLVKQTTEAGRKALYFLFKVKEMQPQNKHITTRKVDPEGVAIHAAKSACVGLYLSWFREIAEGRGDTLRKQVSLGVFDLAYSIYRAGESYRQIQRVCSKEENPSHKAFYSVIRRHLEQYNEGVYRTKITSMFQFYASNLSRFTWIFRLCHIVQEFLALDGEKNSSGCILSFIMHLEKSPWTEGLAREISQEYTGPLQERVCKWIRGEPPNTMFIKEIPGTLWSRYILQPEDLPGTLSLQTAKELLYIGKAQRMLTQLNTDRLDTFLNDLQTERVFDAEWVHVKYTETQRRVKEEYILRHKILEHLNTIRNIFFLFREDFSNSLIKSLSELEHPEMAPAVVDEALERCFGSGIDQMIDIQYANNTLSLVYKSIFPYNFITESISMALAEAFEFFWNMRLAIKKIYRIYHQNRTPHTFYLLSQSKALEYHYYEKIINTLWKFSTLPEDTLYNPEKLSKRVEDIVNLIITLSKETCTLSILQEIITLSIATDPYTYIKLLQSLLQKITYS